VKLTATRRVAPLIVTAILGIFLAVGIARAAQIIWLWPTNGLNYSNAYPSGPWGCFLSNTWQHSEVTQFFDDQYGDQIYLYYMDVYGGYSTLNPVYWQAMYVVPPGGSTETILPPPSHPFSSDWTVWRNKWYDYDPGSLMVETRFTAGSTACLGSSITVYAH